MVIVVRHFFGFILGIVVAPGLLWATGWGYDRTQELKNNTGGSLYAAIGIMAGAGLVFGIVMAARWASPLVTLLPGLGLVAWTIVYAVNPQRAALKLPFGDAIEQGMEGLLITGVYGLLGVAMLMPTFTPSRWRSKAVAEEERNDFF